MFVPEAGRTGPPLDCPKHRESIHALSMSIDSNVWVSVICVTAHSPAGAANLDPAPPNMLYWTPACPSASIAPSSAVSARSRTSSTTRNGVEEYAMISAVVRHDVRGVST